MDNELLNTIGSWSSIIGLIIAFISGVITCKIISKKNIQWNRVFVIFQVGDNNQENNNKQ